MPQTPDDGQRRAAWVATVTALVVVAAFVAGKAARDAILLSNFDIETLPLFVGISALISFPIVLVAGRLMARLGPARLMPMLNLASAVLAVGEWALLSTYPRVIAVAIFFHLSTSGAVLVSGFWSIVNERFDVQSAKRHIGRIGMGAVLGGILGGFVAQATAAYMAPDRIMLVLAGLQLACAATLYGFRGKPRAPVADEAPVEGEGTWFALRVVRRSQLLRSVCFLVVLGAIAATVMDYVFKADIVRNASHDEILRSLAIFYTVTSLLSAVVQIAISGPLIARLGVPRSIATLPVTVTAFGVVALAAPTAFASVLARGAEMIMRNSIYRAGYELVFAPLPETEKRPTKLVLDVGAERLGDMLGAQLVGAIVFAMAVPRIGLLIATVAIGAIAVIVAIRLPRSYTASLEASLLARAAPPIIAATEEEPWLAVGGLPIFANDASPRLLPLRLLERRRRARLPARSESVLATVTALRSSDPERIKRALAAELTPEIAAHVVELVARDDVGRDALVALRAIAPRCTGMVVDALLDRSREVAIRRRLPEVLFAGEPALAAWGLWRGLVDPSFEVRYRCGVVLSRLAATNRLAPVAVETVFEAVRNELATDPKAWRDQRALDDAVVVSLQEAAEATRSGGALDHVFTVLGLVLPPEPLRIALQAVETEDSELRETALEYLESILPTDIRAQLWPLLETEPAPETKATRKARSQAELVAALDASHREILARRTASNPT